MSDGLTGVCLKHLQVFSLDDGPVHAIWRDYGFPLHVIEVNETMKIAVDWLKYACYFNFFEIMWNLSDYKTWAGVSYLLGDDFPCG